MEQDRQRRDTEAAASLMAMGEHKAQRAAAKKRCREEAMRLEETSVQTGAELDRGVIHKTLDAPVAVSQPAPKDPPKPEFKGSTGFSSALDFMLNEDMEEVEEEFSSEGDESE